MLLGKMDKQQGLVHAEIQYNENSIMNVSEQSLVFVFFLNYTGYIVHKISCFVLRKGANLA